MKKRRVKATREEIWKIWDDVRNKHLASRKAATSIARSQIARRMNEPEAKFTLAVAQLTRMGNPKPLAEILLERRISFSEQGWLGHSLLGDINRKRAPGRPESDAKEGAVIARFAYRKWCSALRQKNLSFRGHSESMKTECIRFALQEVEPWLKAKPSAVRRYVDRPNSGNN